MTEHQHATTEVWNLGPKTETEVFEALVSGSAQNGAEHTFLLQKGPDGIWLKCCWRMGTE